MKKTLFVLALLTSSYTFHCQAVGDSLLIGSNQEPQLIVNNRILAKINGKAISVIDLMKKMDLHFYKQYPQYTSSIPARFQFYQANWKSSLTEMIDKELVLADAQENKLDVSAGDVRQEMEAIFGPNIIANLDKVNLTFNEAYKMVLDDISLRRMLYFRVQTKAISEVTPQRIRNFYNDIAKDNVRDHAWNFQVVTIRHKEPSKSAEIANRAHEMLTLELVPLSELVQKIEETGLSDKQPTVNVSEEFQTNDKELSDVFKKILTELTPNSYSSPIAQKSRSTNETIFRIFYLKDKREGGIVPYSELEPKIKDKLIGEAMTRASDEYFKRIRSHFDVQEEDLKTSSGDEFQPFLLK